MSASDTSELQPAERLERLAHQPLDALIIGGGIVGAGVARDAAMRGLRVGLAEQRDFASGTSSRSSRLLHGGLRYLAQGHVGLVRQACREKTILRRIAPHLSEPLEFIFPTRRASGWPRWQLRIGVKLYDWLCGVGEGGGSGSLGVAETLRRAPGIDPARLTGAVRYHDALTNDARLVIDTISSAARHGALACNYVKLLDATPAGSDWRCQLHDQRTGESLTVATRAVVNAAGPWSDQISQSKTALRLTKGVHLVIDRRRLPLAQAIVLAEGSRIMFVIPWGERIILGTTDTDYDGPLDEPPCNADDVAYVLDAVNSAFPAAHLGPMDAMSVWSGVRPLAADKKGNPSDISRRHVIAMSHPGWWDVTGGKLTTHRLMAEETVDSLVGYLGVSAAPCRTAQTPLFDSGDATAFSGVLPPPVSAAAVSRFCRVEGARHLDDVMIRRTSWRHYHHDHLELASETARWMAAELSWDDAQLETEKRRYRDLVVAAEHATTGGPRLSAPPAIGSSIVRN